MSATRSILTVLAAALIVMTLASCQEVQSNNETETPIVTKVEPKTQAKVEPVKPKPIEHKPVEPKPEHPKPVKPVKKVLVKVESKVGPALTFINSSHDFGKSGPSKRLNCEYSFKNTGTEVLKVSKIISTCGCTLPKIVGGKKMADKSTLFKPGETGKITLIFTTPNYEGPVTKHIFAVSNDKENSRYELQIKANVEFSVITTPKRFDLSLKKENAGIGPITIKSKDGKPFAITGFSSMRNAITAKYDRKDKRTEFTIQPIVDIKKLQQAMDGTLTINIDHPETRVIRFGYNTKPLFTLSRPVIIIQRAEPGRVITKDNLILSNYGDKIEIESISCTKGYAEVINQQNLGDRVKMQIKITPPAKERPTSRTFLDKITFKIKGSDFPLTSNISGYYTRTR